MRSERHERHPESSRVGHQRIEELVREHIAAVKRSARESIDRAFCQRERCSPEAGPGESGRFGCGQEASRTHGDRLYRTVCARPREGIAAPAGELGMSPGELQRRWCCCGKRDGCAAAGQRHRTRPTSPSCRRRDPRVICVPSTRRGSMERGREVCEPRVRRLRKTDLTVAEFAAELGVNPKTLAYWKWRLGKEASGGRQRRSRQCDSASSQGATLRRSEAREHHAVEHGGAHRSRAHRPIGPSRPS
jgi:hypothetical protein